MLKRIIIALVLILYIRDKRIAASNLVGQRLPKILSGYDDGADTGINGTFRHQSKELLNTDQDLREGLLVNSILLIYDRELEIKGNPVPWTKIYSMRYKWLTRETGTFTYVDVLAIILITAGVTSYLI